MWGEPTLTTGTLDQPLRYMAREYDAVTGLYYVRARWYDPAARRFNSEDPIRLAGGINPYTYAANDPVSFTDPYGLTPRKGVPVDGIIVYGWCPPGETRGVDGKCKKIDRPSDTAGPPPVNPNDPRGRERGESPRSPDRDKPARPEPKSLCRRMLDAPSDAQSGVVHFNSVSGTYAVGAGSTGGVGFYWTSGGDFGIFDVTGIGVGLDASIDIHRGIATSMAAFEGKAGAVCVGGATYSLCAGGNPSGNFGSAGWSIGVPSPNVFAGVTNTRPISVRQKIADAVCR